MLVISKVERGSWFQTFPVFWMLYAFLWVIPSVWIVYADVSEHCLFHLRRPMKMEHTERSETSAYKIQTQRNYPEESIQHRKVLSDANFISWYLTLFSLGTSRFGQGPSCYITARLVAQCTYFEPPQNSEQRKCDVKQIPYWTPTNIRHHNQGRRLRVASGATAPGPALEGAPRFRPMSLSSYILR